ncbi:YmfQ family protein [Erwinia amylovora]|uniref:YmfQ family protein n=1 Tax=Erwinia amylovora TaxID=552 RepID=UPI0014443215|nr:YmfQ family protein [Erwinia amylovora]
MIIYSVSDYTRALQSLMPVGLAWPKTLDAVQTAVLRTLARSFQRNDCDARRVLMGAFPATATIMLPEWEETLGLPDDCSIGEIDSIAKRQAAVVAKLISTGGQSIAYFITIASTLGYDITITQYRQARAGMSVCGDALNGEDWPFTWRINAPRTTIKYALTGISYCGDPLRSWGNKQLECQLNRLAPSHLILLFNYAG